MEASLEVLIETLFASVPLRRFFRSPMLHGFVIVTVFFFADSLGFLVQTLRAGIIIRSQKMGDTSGAIIPTKTETFDDQRRASELAVEFGAQVGEFGAQVESHRLRIEVHPSCPSLNKSLCCSDADLSANALIGYCFITMCVSD